MPKDPGSTLYTNLPKVWHFASCTSKSWTGTHQHKGVGKFLNYTWALSLCSKAKLEGQTKPCLHNHLTDMAGWMMKKSTSGYGGGNCNRKWNHRLHNDRLKDLYFFVTSYLFPVYSFIEQNSQLEWSRDSPTRLGGPDAYTPLQSIVSLALPSPNQQTNKPRTRGENVTYLAELKTNGLK